MRRSALREMIIRLLTASLPLAGMCACGQTPQSAGQDLAASAPIDFSLAQPDLSQAQPDSTVLADLSGPDATPCPTPQKTACEDVYFVDGGVPSISTSADCKAICTDGVPVSCTATADSCGVTVYCNYCSIGRRPATLVTPGDPGAEALLDATPGHEVGCFFAGVAHLEAASVEAFQILARELEEHGAPRSLIESAHAAAGDEARHAQMTSALARRHGMEPAAVDTRPAPIRGLAALALDNAVEGCVRETFGALVARWQGLAAEDAAIRKSMAAIAEDETRHAELAWAIAEWAEPQLDETTRASITAARRAAAATLRDQSGTPIPRPLTTTAGVPCAVQLQFLATRFALEIEQFEARPGGKPVT